MSNRKPPLGVPGIGKSSTIEGDVPVDEPSRNDGNISEGFVKVEGSMLAPSNIQLVNGSISWSKENEVVRVGSMNCWSAM